MGSAGDAAVPAGRTRKLLERVCLSPWFSQSGFLTFPLELCSDDWGRSKGLWSLPAVLEHPRAPAGAAGHLQASVGLCPHLAMAAPCLALLQLPGFGFAAMGRS